MGLGSEVFGLLQMTRPMFCPKAFTVRTLKLDVRAAGSVPLPAMQHIYTDGPEIKEQQLRGEEVPGHTRIIHLELMHLSGHRTTVC